jgi:hypothetical protein
MNNNKELTDYLQAATAGKKQFCDWMERCTLEQIMLNVVGEYQWIENGTLRVKIGDGSDLTFHEYKGKIYDHFFSNPYYRPYLGCEEQVLRVNMENRKNLNFIDIKGWGFKETVGAKTLEDYLTIPINDAYNKIYEMEMDKQGKTKVVFIPANEQHAGIEGITVKLLWFCPVCGERRGEVEKVRSYDGSRILFCDGWFNRCGHVDKYPDIRQEAKENMLNTKIKKGV